MSTKRPTLSAAAPKKSAFYCCTPILVQGIATVVVMDSPLDRGRPPYLGGCRHSPEHVDDLTAVLRWAAAWAQAPACLVGTSPGARTEGRDSVAG